MRTTRKGSKPGLALDTPTCLRSSTELRTARSVDVGQAAHLDGAGTEKEPIVGNDCPRSSKEEDLSLRTIAPDVDTDEYYPEGGAQAWLVTFGSFCAMFGAFGLLNTVGTLQAYLAENQLKDYTQASISWIFSIYIFLVFFCGLLIGPIFDKNGPRLLLVTGTILELISLMLLGLCTEYWHFVVDFSILGGLACSLLFTPAIGAIAHWFCKKRGTATGIAACGGSCGGVIFPLMLTSLLPRIGWAWSTRVLGLIFVLLCTLSVCLTRSRLPPKRGSTIWPDFRIFLDGSGAFALATAGTFFMEFGLFVPLTYITPYALASGTIDRTFSFQLLAIFNGASCFGRFSPGFLADKWGRYNTMLVANAACIATVFGLWLPAHGNVGLVIAFAVLFGFASGSNISLTPICIGQLCGTEEYGRYYATAYTVVSFSSLTGIPIAGLLINAGGGSYSYAILFTGLCYCASFVCFACVRVGRCGWDPRKVF